MIAFGGQSPVVAEYDIEFPVCGEYTMHVFYAAAGVRPVELYLDGKPIGKCCSGTTGTWNTSGAKWEEAGKLSIAVGKHTIKLQREGAFPHVVSLRFDAPVPLPPEWTPKLPPPRKPGSHARRPCRCGRMCRRGQRRGPAAGDRRPGGDLRPALSDAARIPAATGRAGTASPTAGRRRCRNGNAQERRHGRNFSSSWPPCGTKRCWPIRCWTSTGCCWSSGATIARTSACRRTGRATRSLPKTGYDDEIAVLSPVRPDGQLTTLYQAGRRPVRRRRGPALRRRAAAVLDAGRQRPLAGLRDPRRRQRACGS